jgi:hypothetical protein
MVIGSDLLSAWYGAQVARTSAFSAAPVTRSTQAAEPTEPAPWEAGSGQEPNADLLRNVLANGDFFTSQFGEFEDLEVSDDEKQLFALYEGLRALSAIAESISNEEPQSWELDLYARRFGEGVDQLTGFFEDLDLENVQVFQGKDISNTESELEIPRTDSEYTTGIIYAGDYEAEVPAFTGDVSFDINVRKSNVDYVVNIDLSEMGATERTMENVQDYINGKLEAEGLITRFDATKIGEEDEDGIIQGNNFGWNIEGVSTEVVTFSDSAASDSLIVAGVSGMNEDAAGQITKISDLVSGGTIQYSERVEADPTVTTETNSLDEEVEKTTSNALTIDDVVYGTDGSSYVVGRGTVSVDGQAIRGDGDLVVAKYDSAGNQIWTRVLGASSDAEGASIAVDSNGDIVVAGSVTGNLGDTTDVGGTDSLVVKFDQDGEEQWLQRFGASADDQANAVTIGSDGTIYVAGETQSSLAGNGYVGGTDAYVRAIDSDGNTLYTRALDAASGEESARAVTLASDGGLLVASEVDGNAVLTKYAAGDDGTGAADWTLDLGALGSGWIGEIAVDSVGDIYLAGAADSGFAPGTVVNANAGNRDAMLTKINTNGGVGAPSVDYVTFLGNSAENAANDLVIAVDTVYIAGRTSEALTGTGIDDQRQSFVAAFDASTGAVGDIVEFGGRGGLSEATGIALATNADSSLDIMGLPTGELYYSDSRVIVENSTIREGDFFYIQVDGGAKQKIEIEADDTMRSLALRIDRELLLDGSGDVARGSNGDALKITAAAGTTITLIPGTEGRDALSGLGITAGSIRGEVPDDEERVSSFELELNQDLDISDEEKALETLEILKTAMQRVQYAYQSLYTDTSDDGTPVISGTAPAYYQQRLANYEAGLDRLAGGGGGTTLGLF